MEYTECGKIPCPNFARFKCTPLISIRSSDWCVCLKMPGCCCLNEMGKKILFRINWRHVTQGFNVAP
jgi:hypothetical protein